MRTFTMAPTGEDSQPLRKWPIPRRCGGDIAKLASFSASWRRSAPIPRDTSFPLQNGRGVASNTVRIALSCIRSRCRRGYRRARRLHVSNQDRKSIPHLVVHNMGKAWADDMVQGSGGDRTEFRTCGRLGGWPAAISSCMTGEPMTAQAIERHSSSGSLEATGVIDLRH